MIIMKKQYIQPATETVKLNIKDDVLDIDILNNSRDVTDEGLAKENSDIVFDDNFGDLWDNPDADSNAFDLWGE